MTMQRAAGFLRGRSNRREYWLMIGVLIALSYGLSRIMPTTGAGGAVAVAFAQIRRLHDLGKTGWWAAAIALLQIVLAVPIVLAELPAGLFDLAVAAVTLAPIVALGLPPGQAFENRFGPSPGSRALSKIFS